jgi:hypothetical protein
MQASFITRGSNLQTSVVLGQEIVGASFGNAPNSKSSNMRNYLTSSGSQIDGDYLGAYCNNIGNVLPEVGKYGAKRVAIFWLTA